MKIAVALAARSALESRTVDVLVLYGTANDADVTRTPVRRVQSAADSSGGSPMAPPPPVVGSGVHVVELVHY